MGADGLTTSAAAFAALRGLRHSRSNNRLRGGNPSMPRSILALAGIALLAAAGTAQAQAPAAQPAAPAAPAASAPPPEYGVSISTADAKKAAAAAIAQVPKSGSPPDAVAIVDTGGYLVYLERMDNTQIGSVQGAIDKGRGAALSTTEK